VGAGEPERVSLASRRRSVGISQFRRLASEIGGSWRPCARCSPP
jgi:hypothetical protein